MEQTNSVTQVVPSAEQAPVIEHLGGTGPNEFEQEWSALHAAANAAVSNEENGQALAPGAPQGSPGVGATDAALTEESFLSPEEVSRFDTNSPEYKAMQASFTRKMQGLANREKALLASQEQALPDQSGTMPPEISYDGFKSTIALPDELEPYRGPLAAIAIEVAKQTVAQLQTQAAQVAQQQQQVEFKSKIQRELTELQTGPRAADFNRYYNEIAAIATESPNVVRRIGLSGILNMFAGKENSPAPVANGQNGYAQGVQDTLSRMASRKQAGSHEPVQGPPNASGNSAVPQFKPGISMNDAVAQAFHAAQAKVAGR